jgi:transcriptional regulator of met regulon
LYQIPKITASTYNGKSVYSKYNITISIPLKSAETRAEELARRNNTK